MPPGLPTRAGDARGQNPRATIPSTPNPGARSGQRAARCASGTPAAAATCRAPLLRLESLERERCLRLVLNGLNGLIPRRRLVLAAPAVSTCATAALSRAANDTIRYDYSPTADRLPAAPAPPAKLDKDCTKGVFLVFPGNTGNTVFAKVPHKIRVLI